MRPLSPLVASINRTAEVKRNRRLKHKVISAALAGIIKDKGKATMVAKVILVVVRDSVEALVAKVRITTRVIKSLRSMDSRIIKNSWAVAMAVVLVLEVALGRTLRSVVKVDRAASADLDRLVTMVDMKVNGYATV